MKLITPVALAVLALAAAGGATAAADRPVASAERDSSYQTVDHRGRSRETAVEDALSRTLTLCEAVQGTLDIPVDCEVTEYKGYPTMLLSFSNTRAVERYSGAVVDKLALPFCEALIVAVVDARLVLFVRDVRMARIYACETGKLSDWVRVASR